MHHHPSVHWLLHVFCSLTPPPHPKARHTAINQDLVLCHVKSLWCAHHLGVLNCHSMRDIRQNSVGESHHQNLFGNSFSRDCWLWTGSEWERTLSEQLWQKNKQKKKTQSTRREASRPSLVHLHLCSGHGCCLQQSACALLCSWLMRDCTVGRLHPAGTISHLGASRGEPIWNLTP